MMKRSFRKQCPATGILFAFLITCMAIVAIASAQDDPGAQSVVEKRLPGEGWVTRLSDGSLVSFRLVTILNTNQIYKSIFTASADNPLRWTDIALQGSLLPQSVSLYPVVGGDSELIYIMYQDDRWSSRDTKMYGRRFIYAQPLGKDGGALPGDRAALARAFILGRPFGEDGRILQDVPSRSPSHDPSRPHFASKNIGVVTVDSDLHLTTDAGETWKHSYSIEKIDEHRNDVSGLLWLDDTRLLVAGDRGSVELLLREGDTLRPLWTINLTKSSFFSPHRMAPDGDRHAWIEAGGKLARVDLKTGRINASIDPRVSFDGMATCHGRLLLWGSTMGPIGDFNPGLAVWGRVANDPEYTRQHTILLQGLLIPLGSHDVVGVVEVDGPECLVFMHSGEAVRLNLETGEMGSAGLHVERAPWPDIADIGQLTIAAELAFRLPDGRVRAILDEAAAKENLTPREQADWAIERMRENLAALGPAARTPPWEDPTRPTIEQINAMSRLRQEWVLAELPMERWVAILESRKPELTKREEMQWRIEQLHKALNEHPEDPAKPTIEQIDALNQLRGRWVLKQMNLEQYYEIILKSYKLDLTPRQQTQWAIDRIREALDEESDKQK